jgi:hypothetical protein
MGIVFGRTGISADNGLSPAFETMSTLKNGIEIRNYPSFLVAEVEPASDKEGPENDRELRSKAFNALARYIGVFGNPENDASDKISMTAPVLMESKTEKISMTSPVISTPGATSASRTMSFIMPSKYENLEDLPKPKDPRIKLKKVPNMVVLCMTFYGRVNDGGLSKLSEFIQLCLQDNIVKSFVNSDISKNTWRLASYTPPFTLPMYQKNEIHILLPSVKPEDIKKELEDNSK